MVLFDCFTCILGMRRPLRLSVNELKRKFKVHTMSATVQCAGNRRSNMASEKVTVGIKFAQSVRRWRPPRITRVTTTTTRATTHTHTHVTQRSPQLSASRGQNRFLSCSGSKRGQASTLGKGPVHLFRQNIKIFRGLLELCWRCCGRFFHPHRFHEVGVVTCLIR